MSVEELIVRVRAEFHEMPGMHLTIAQARRLWNLNEETCKEVVDVMVSRGLLRRHADRIMAN